MVTEQKTKDNSWFQQPCFNSSLIKTWIRNRRIAGGKLEPFKQANYSLPENFHCRLSDLYQGEIFKSEAALQEMVRNRTGLQDFTLAPNTHIRLRDAMKFVIKNKDKHNNQPVKYPNSVPLNH